MEKRKTSPKRVIAFVILGIGACTMVLPFLWMLSTSLKDANLVYAIPPQWIPNPVDWENYRDIWSAANLLTGIKNSLIVTVLVLLFSTLTSSMAAFAFAKLKFPAKRIIFLMLLSTMMCRPRSCLYRNISCTQNCTGSIRCCRSSSPRRCAISAIRFSFGSS